MSKKHLIEFKIVNIVLILCSKYSSCVARTRRSIGDMHEAMITAAEGL